MEEATEAKEAQRTKSMNITHKFKSETELYYKEQIPDSYPRGGYFMTKGEEDAAIGRMVSEYGDSKKRLQVLTEEAHRLGAMFSELGVCLTTNPQNLSIDGEPMNPSFSQFRHELKSRSLDAEKLKSLVNDIRKTSLDIERLEPKVKELGLL